MPVLHGTDHGDGPRLCLVGNPDSIHVRRWASHFAGRDFDVHVMSFYSPRLAAPPGVTVDFLRERNATQPAGRARTAAQRTPGLLRLATAARLMRAGFGKAIARLEPDVVHAHYVSDYGFLAALTRRRPLVVSAWGSDLLVDPQSSLITRNLIRWVLSRADLVTYDAEQVAGAARRLGAAPGKLLEVVVGVEDEFVRIAAAGPPPAQREPLVVSLRSLERPAYNVELIVRAMKDVVSKVPGSRLLIGNDGAMRDGLEQLARELGIGASVDFVGVVQRPQLAELLGRAATYVSVPASDGTSVTLLEAMAAGAFPIVSDLPSNREWVEPPSGDVVPTGSVAELSGAIVRSLTDPDRRAAAAKRNLALVTRRGLWEPNMARVEDAYRSLVAGSVRSIQ